MSKWYSGGRTDDHTRTLHDDGAVATAAIAAAETAVGSSREYDTDRDAWGTQPIHSVIIVSYPRDDIPTYLLNESIFLLYYIIFIISYIVYSCGTSCLDIVSKNKQQ